jgi:hypothetical protein
MDWIRLKIHRWKDGSLNTKLKPADKLGWQWSVCETSSFDRVATDRMMRFFKN